MGVQNFINLADVTHISIGQQMNQMKHLLTNGNKNWMTDWMANPTLPNAAAIRSWYELVLAMVPLFSIRIME